jgi:hypothetical protein
MSNTKNKSGRIISVIILALAIPFIGSLFYAMSYSEYLNSLPKAEKLAYGFLGAVYIVGSLGIMLVGVPYLVEKFLNE